MGSLILRYTKPFNLLPSPPAGCVLWLPGQDDAYSATIRDRSGQHPAIDVGSAAINRGGNYTSEITFIDLANIANFSGRIDSIEIWANTDMTGLRVGTFYLVSGVTYKCRDSVLIGSVTAGSKQTFGVSLEVKVGDYIGCYSATGGIERDYTGGSGVVYVAGEYIDAGDEAAYTLDADDAISLYVTGIATQGNDGTITGATWTRLPSGLWCLSFDGDDYVSCGNAVSLQINGNITLLSWLNPTQFVSNRYVIGKYSYAVYINTTGVPRFETRKADNSGWDADASGGALTANKPNFVAAVFDTTAQTKTTYTNAVAGTAVAKTDGGFGAITTYNLNLSRDPSISLYFLIGTLSLVRVISSALTATQVASIYQQERHLFGV